MDENDVALSKNGLWQYYFNGMLRKSFSWFDQMEWRLILPEIFIKENYLVKFYKITKVFLGINMPKTERKKLLIYVKNIKYHMKE